MYLLGILFNLHSCKNTKLLINGSVLFVRQKCRRVFRYKTFCKNQLFLSNNFQHGVGSFIRSPVVLLRCCGGRLLGKKIKFIPRSFVSKQVINAEMVLTSCSRKDCEGRTCEVVIGWFLG